MIETECFDELNVFGANNNPSPDLIMNSEYIEQNQEEKSSCLNFKKPKKKNTSNNSELKDDKISCLYMFSNKKPKSSISNGLLPNSNDLEIPSEPHNKQSEIEQHEINNGKKENFFIRYFLKSRLFDKSKQRDTLNCKASNEVIGANNNICSITPTSDV